MMWIRIVPVLFIVLIFSCKNLSQVKHDRPSNHLIHETSPYLLQHAYNPVDWHPWGPEALDKAQKENKLLIVSIGYAACHWCHVMEHESFEDSTVAAIMNEHFVPIKVDREERPDVDDIYMSAAQLITGSGGWPLNAFALPDGRPVWAGTYFPKERWMDILNQFAKLKNEDYPRLENSANQLTEGIQSLDAIVVTPPGEYAIEDLSNMGEKFIKQIDQIHGGRRGAPKFPMPNNYEFLLRYATLTDNPIAKESLEVTLRKMAEGGIYDHVGGGFARYSVDEVWKVPHFEKMLYDNGQLVSLYSQAYRQNPVPLYKEVIEQSLEYTAREMTSEEGGFYSSLDADSEGVEGKFYIWKEEEIDALITDAASLDIYKRYYSVTPEGNWEHDNSILHVTEDPIRIAKDNGLTLEELESLIAKWDAVVLEKRAERIRPGLDDKILTSWNALMSKGYIEAYKALGKHEYLKIAERNLHFLLNKQLQDDFRLNRNYKNGKSSINAFLDDYALLIDAMLSMYEVTFDESWLNISNDLTGYVVMHFFDTNSKMFFYTSDIDPPLIARKLELSDNVISGSNSIMARNLKKLGELMYNQSYIETSDQMLSNIWTNISKVQQPSFYSNWLQLLIEQIYPPYEIAIVGKDAMNLSQEMQKSYHPNAVYLGAQDISTLALLENKLVEGETLIYVCQNKTCKFPVKDVDQALALMK